jgi:hypothetical protein
MNDLKPNENLWNKISSRKRPIRIIDLPIYDDEGKSICKVMIRTLTQEDIERIRTESYIDTQKQLKDTSAKDTSKTFCDAFENHVAINMILKAYRNPENEKIPFFPSAQEIRSKLEPDEIALLIMHYQTFQSELSPIVSNMNEKELNDYIEKLAKSGSEGEYFLDLLSAQMQNELIIFMVNKLTDYQMDKSSPGSQQEDIIDNQNL